MRLKNETRNTLLNPFIFCAKVHGAKSTLDSIAEAKVRLKRKRERFCPSDRKTEAETARATNDLSSLKDDNIFRTLFALELPFHFAHHMKKLPQARALILNPPEAVCDAAL